MARRAVVTVCIALLGGFSGSVAHAEKTKAAPTANKAEIDRLKQLLETGAEPEKLAALDELGNQKSGSVPLAAATVNDLLVRGASVAVLTRALGVTGKLAQPSSTAAVAPYARHRNEDVRLAATRALATTGGPDAVGALRAILHGGDRASRGFAASGLASLKAKEAVPDLFAVLAKDVPEAAGAIGELCVPPDCGKFVAELGRLPFDLMQSGLAPLLLRPETEVPAEFKLDLLERLRKLQTDEAHKFLETLKDSYPEKGNAWVKYGLEQAVGNKPVVPPPAAKTPAAKGKAK
ncbi:MAG TPA: HEAT repeat domain-containing protein [Polyangiaceae bacterium]|nr:HEAT repeat domain-containing protein [Polyangiaceae bacterium]